MSIVFWVVAGYLATIWIGLRLLVPNLAFRKRPLPEVIPQEFSTVIKKLSDESKNDFEFLEKAYTFVTTKYTGAKYKALTNFWVAFQDPVNRPAGFMPCTSQNYLIRLMLVKSGRYKDSDVEVKTVPFHLFIHQYLRVRVGKRAIEVDPWSAFLGLPLGKKSAFFG